MDYKDVLRRFINDAETGRLRRKRMPFTGSVLNGLVAVAFSIALAALIVSIYNLVMG